MLKFIKNHIFIKSVGDSKRSLGWMGVYYYLKSESNGKLLHSKNESEQKFDDNFLWFMVRACPS